MTTSAPNSEKKPIAEKVSSCHQAFADLCNTLETQAEADVSSWKVSQQVKEGDISLNTVKHEFDRFQLWCNATHANEEGPSSLDDGLQLAAYICKAVLDILNNLEELLEDAKDILDGKKIPWDQEVSHPSESDDDTDDDDDDDDDSARTWFKGPEDKSELFQIRDCIVNGIDCLNRLNTAIEWNVARRLDSQT
ncbi:hypothetical protein FSARC_9105 [Fusarium sarcochroum]|uniref:Uncharacterized protein n=1 Tax=Fusarium sarcochroum TaxID=1208366 RepID=A0A8H4X5L7_9HYPO|nr:hypothetical protein FSARC_9105 [Fusarium sarcochroum]